jgi:hypothetical protein
MCFSFFLSFLLCIWVAKIRPPKKKNTEILSSSLENISAQSSSKQVNNAQN